MGTNQKGNLSKVFVISVLMLFLAINSFASNLDSLLSVYLKSKDNYNRILVAAKIADDNKSSNPKLAEEYYSNALRISENLKIDSLTVKFLLLMTNYAAARNINEGSANIRRAYNICTKNKDYKRLFKVSEFAVTFYNTISNADSIKVYLDYFKVNFENFKSTTKDQKLISRYENDLIVLNIKYYQKIGNYKLSSSYGEKLLSIARKLNDNLLLFKAYSQLAHLNISFEEYHTSIKYFTLLLDLDSIYKIANPIGRSAIFLNLGTCYRKIGNLKKAEEFYLQCLSLKLKHNDNEASLARLYNNLAGLAKDMKNYKLAFESYEKALVIFKKMGNSELIGSTMVNLGSLHFSAGNNEKSYEYLSYVEKNYTFSNFPEARLELLRNLSEIYEVRGDFRKSLNYYKEYRILKDSLFTDDLRKSVKKYQELYETEKKDREISELTKAKEISDLKNQKQTSRLRLIIGLIVFVVIMLVVSLLWFVNKRKIDKAIFAKNQEINRRQMLEVISQQDVNTVNAFMKGQEKERGRIASDLHDRLGSLLSTVKLHFSSIEASISDPENKENFEYAIKLLDKSVSEVRSVSHNLTKEVLTQLGLIQTIENLADAINSAGKLKINIFKPENEYKFSSDIEIELYRIIQETITNIIKHANANEVTIQFLVNDGNLNLIIEDDGVGFEPSKVNSEGMGLSNIYNRINKIQGAYSIDSTPGAGSTFIFDIPLEKKEAS